MHWATTYQPRGLLSAPIDLGCMPGGPPCRWTMVTQILSLHARVLVNHLLAPAWMGHFVCVPSNLDGCHGGHPPSTKSWGFVLGLRLAWEVFALSGGGVEDDACRR